MLEAPRFGFPSMADQALILLHPLPINPSVKAFGQLADFLLLRIAGLIIFPRKQDASHQQRGIDGR